MKFALVNPEIDTKIPKPATTGSVGLDIYATSKKVVPITVGDDGKIKGGYTAYGTNLAFEIPDGVVCFLIPRSSVRDKSQILANGVGLPDRDYRGEVFFSFKEDGRGSYKSEYEVGDHIGQLVFVLAATVAFDEQVSYNELSTTERGAGGHGSTDAPSYSKKLPDAVEGTKGVIVARGGSLVLLNDGDEDFSFTLTDEDLGEYTPQTKFEVKEGKLTRAESSEKNEPVLDDSENNTSESLNTETVPETEKEAPKSTEVAEAPKAKAKRTNVQKITDNDAAH